MSPVGVDWIKLRSRRAHDAGILGAIAANCRRMKYHLVPASRFRQQQERLMMAARFGISRPYFSPIRPIAKSGDIKGYLPAVIVFELQDGRGNPTALDGHFHGVEVKSG